MSNWGSLTRKFEAIRPALLVNYFIIIGRPHPLTWVDWIQLAADDAVATAVCDFALVWKANFQQRVERVSIAQSLLTAVFAGLFTQSLIMAYMNAAKN